MPTYDYACRSCGHSFEQFQSIKAAPLTTCPNCAAEALARLLGTGAGIVFKGDGFYTTDYRSESYTSGAKADTSTSSSSASDGGGTCGAPACSTGGCAAGSGSE